jgi:hypothetical protein
VVFHLPGGKSPNIGLARIVNSDKSAGPVTDRQNAA